MRLVTHLTLLIASFAAAAPSVQHGQISVEATHTDVQNQADVVHSSEELGMNHGGFGLKNLPFNFTLSASYADGHPAWPLGFESLTIGDGLIRGELGFRTEFAFRDGKLINGNRALGAHLTKPWPGWTSLWSLEKKKDWHPWYDLIAIPKQSGGGTRHFVEFASSGKLTLVASILSIPRALTGGSWLKDQIFGAFELKHKAPVFVGPPQGK